MHVFCICTCSAQLSMFHKERRSRNTLIIIIITFFADFKQNPGRVKAAQSHQLLVEATVHTGKLGRLHYIVTNSKCLVPN